MGKFDSFEIISTDYKIVEAQEIAVDVFLPASLQEGPHPVIVRFHGGGYVRFYICQLHMSLSRNISLIISGQRLQSF